MVISRMQLVKELEPGLNALFGLEYDRYENQNAEIFDSESSDRAFEEEVMLGGFANAAVKPEGQGIVYDDAQETYTARYTNETVALAFALTEEAVEDNLYDKISTRYTKALARSMANTKQVKGSNVLNNSTTGGATAGGDGVALLSAAHPTLSGNQTNLLATASDLNETSLETALIEIANMKDERGLKIALRGMKMILPVNLQFVAERLMNSAGRVGTADNDINAIKSMGMVPQGYVINNFLVDTDAWYVKTDAPNGLKHFTRAPIRTAMEGDFDTGNVRYKARERYSFGWSDWRGIFGTPGAA
tara:strand:+ start:319 stop:1230 length:912 start_codon:yes stop_codon:yes gene_type:complete